MRSRFYWAFCLVIFFLIEVTIGKDNIKTKSNTKKQNSTNDKLKNDRGKRSLNGDEMPFWPNRGRRLPMSELAKDDKSPNNDPMDKEPPFWGTRGRRDDSSSIENFIDSGPPLNDDSMFYAAKCKHCYATPLIDNYDDNRFSKELRDEQGVPFWGNRGKRDSGYDNAGSDPFWGNRGKKQEDDPFWGARGRREDELPFWGNIGRRFSWGKQDNLEDTPFWGNRGRRDEMEPFWGNRGRRDEVEPFWGNRGRRDEVEPFWGSRGRRESKNKHRDNIEKILHDAIIGVEDNIESLARSRRDTNPPNFYWENKNRDSKLSNFFKYDRHRYQRRGINTPKNSESRTVLDDRMFAEQPHYILVERSSRSSTEDDPFFISRGKKMFTEDPYPYKDKRGSMEDLLKSVRNDPYYIARGKKHVLENTVGNSSLLSEDLDKAKDLICATIDLLLYNKGNKAKRELDNNNDRDRRTILKKLAAQLQNDPYFASRGKKNESGFNDDNLKDFINEVSVKCNYLL